MQFVFTKKDTMMLLFYACLCSIVGLSLTEAWRVSPISSVRANSSQKHLIRRRFPHVELANTLVKRLDKTIQHQILQQPWTRWNKYVVQQRFSLIGKHETEFVYVLEPPNRRIPPSCAIVFTGGAGLGSYPHISYNEFLVRLSNQLNAVIISAPYQIQLDHYELAKKTGDLYQNAVEKLAKERSYPSNMPVYNLSHSLGSKLSCIYSAATNHDYQGLGFISFNNFGFGRTVSLAKSFLENIKQQHNEHVIDNLFKMADFAVAAAGIEFSPSPFEMERLILRKYNKSNRLKTRLFTFADDDLCSGSDFFETCRRNGLAPQISYLPGTHLTPVFISGLQSHEQELDHLVDEVSNWVLGKDPSTPLLLPSKLPPKQ